MSDRSHRNLGSINISNSRTCFFPCNVFTTLSRFWYFDILILGLEGKAPSLTFLILFYSIHVKDPVLSAKLSPPTNICIVLLPATTPKQRKISNNPFVSRTAELFAEIFAFCIIFLSIQVLQTPYQQTLINTDTKIWCGSFRFRISHKSVKAEPNNSSAVTFL